jgi:hypothetical protein
MSLWKWKNGEIQISIVNRIQFRNTAHVRSFEGMLEF